MLDLSNDHAEICVVGRTNFTSGIAAVSYSACELLARSFPVCILPTDQPPEGARHVVLPNGRPIPICTDTHRIRVFFYTDILWNGAHDLNFTRVPARGLRIAHIAYDSDELPSRWAEILNLHFDVALFTSRHLEQIAADSGVRIPVGTLPVGLDLEPALARTVPKPPSHKVRFGSLAAWHERKDNLALLQAFLEEFDDDDSVELVLHSNLTIGDAHEALTNYLKASGARNVSVGHEHLALAEKDALLDSIDILANCSRGEGYSIAPREALARGQVLVVSDIGAHRDLLGPPGVFAVPAAASIPARYPEIDHQVFGRQIVVDKTELRQALRTAYVYLKTVNSDEDVWMRKHRAAEFSFSSLATSYAELINRDIRAFRTTARTSDYVHLPVLPDDAAQLGTQARNLSTRNWVVVPAMDAGFFSVFNGFMSHLTWELQEERCQGVVPDWDVSRLLSRIAPTRPTSFCYGTPADGNVWCHLFEPLYGLSVTDMNDTQLLDRKCSEPEAPWNEHRESLLTYIRAYDLYRSPSFRKFRRQYHSALREHVRLLPHFAEEIESSTASFESKFMIAAHVKHPSHGIEQPGGALAATTTYLDRIEAEIARQAGLQSSDWGVFLATDQDSVVLEFEKRFGEHLHVFRDVRRSSLADDAAFRKLSASERAQPGYQVQHLVAQSPQDWSVRMAWEVIRDALAMARCNAMLHVVSNVATAVSYLNPDLQMIFCEPDSLASAAN